MNIPKKISLILAFGVILLLVLFSLFPQLFSKRSPTDVFFQLQPPNRGFNSFTLENLCNGSVKIDSLILDFGQREILLGRDIELAEGAEFDGTFRLTDLSQKDFTNRFVVVKAYCSPEISKLLLFFNGSEFPEKLKLRNGLLYASINRYLFINRKSKYPRPFLVRSVMGTDTQGRDLWSRLIYATPLVIKILFLSLLISVPLGILLGLLHGYFTGFIPRAIGILSNLCNALPIYLTAMIVVAIFGTEIHYIIIAFSLVQWIEIEKAIFNKVQLIKKNDFIRSAKMFGKSDLQIIITDILPLCWSEIILCTVFMAKRLILIEAGLSFIGYSVSIPNPSWGNILADAHSIIFQQRARWIILWPSVFILMTTFSLDRLEHFFRKDVFDA